jgi:tetratricopeptide (TPR) repeat protein
MAKSPTKKKYPRPLLVIAGVAFAFFSIALLTYLFIGSRGRIPEMPRISVKSSETDEAMRSLEERAAGFAPTEEERALIDALETLHIAETDHSQGVPPQLRTLLENLREQLAAYATSARLRFLLLGDYLALRLHKVLVKKLSLMAKEDPEAQLVDPQIHQFGGAFYERLVEKGIVLKNGECAVSSALFPVLFRYRWRLLSGVESDAAFTNVEKRLLNDFVVRFVDSNQKERRLRAAEALYRLDPNYEITIAKARVLYEAGEEENAIRALEEALKRGERNREIEGFLSALTEK